MISVARISQSASQSVVLLISFATALLVGCTSIPAHAEITPTAPQPIAPQNGAMFVDSAPMLAWEWPGLLDNEAYALRIWTDDNPDDYREVLASAPSVTVQEAVDSFGTDVDLFHWQVAVIRISQEHGFEGMVSEWGAIRSIRRVRHINPTPVPPSMQSDAARYVASQGFSSATEIIDGARDFVYRNSTNERGQEPGLPDRSDTLQQMVEYSQGRAEAPSLLCDGISTSLLTLLLELGIDSRLIFLYGDVQGSIVEHTMLEAFNPDTQCWELQDPSGNTYIADEQGERVSIERAVFGPLQTLRACSMEQCTRQKLEWFVSYFQAFRYGYTNEVWVNPDRFNISKRFADEEDMNLAEYLTNGNPRDFLFRFGTVQPLQ